MLELVLQHDFHISELYDCQVMNSFSATQQSSSLTLIPGSCPTLTESLRVELTAVINTALTTKPYPQIPHPRAFWSLPGMVIPPLLQPWGNGEWQWWRGKLALLIPNQFYNEVVSGWKWLRSREAVGVGSLILAVQLSYPWIHVIKNLSLISPVIRGLIMWS